MPGYTWKSHMWDNPKSMLDDFIFRSKNFSLLFETKGDVWVVDDTKYKPDIYQTMLKKRPVEVKDLYAAQESVPLKSIPWQNYDVIISLDRIIPQSFFKQYPSVLWCYYASEHSSSGYLSSLLTPYPRYDLFLDHMLNKRVKTLSELPTVIHFPAILSRQAMQETINLGQKRDAVFIDSHGIRNLNLDIFRREMQVLFGITVDFPKPWIFKRSYSEVANRKPLSTKDFLQNLANCKYFWLKRRAGGGGFAGQAAPEAAALGCVVLADESCQYAKHLCHPITIMPDGADKNNAARIIKLVQNDNKLYQEIIERQNRNIDSFFCRNPIAQLEKYVKTKHAIVNKTITIASIPKKKSIAYSVISAGRNDNYGGNFKLRALKTARRNVEEARERGVNCEWIFIEWNPTNDDYLSYDLARNFGYTCYIVSPKIHDKVVHYSVKDRMTFCQFLAINVGIRAASGNTIICTHPDDIFGIDVWDFLKQGKIDPNVLYRARRYDIAGKWFDKKFETMDAHRGLDHGGGPTNAAGDFLMFAASRKRGFDESTACFSDIHTDGRFVRDWMAELTGGKIDLDKRYYRFIGTIYKHDHPMIYRRTSTIRRHHRGKLKWESLKRTHKGHNLYKNSGDWGLVNESMIKLARGVYYVG